MHIDNDVPTINTSAPEIELMGLELNGVPLNPKVENNRNVVSIPWNHSSLIINIMPRENDVFTKKMLRFEIGGLDRKSVETYDHILTVGALPRGKYRIMVSCSLKNGGWSAPVEVLKVNITPPWFASFWFIGIVIIFIVSTLVYLYKMAIVKKERKIRWDKKEHEQQTY